MELMQISQKMEHSNQIINLSITIEPCFVSLENIHIMPGPFLWPGFTIWLSSYVLL